MKVRVSIKTTARATRVSGQDPPLDIAISLTIENAERGAPIVGTVEKALAAANKAVGQVLETRRY